MIRLMAPSLFAMLALGVWIYAVMDSISTDSALVRNLPKITWIFIVLLFPPIGPIAWLGFGRPLHAGYRPGDTSRRTPRPARGFEDSDQWSQSRPPLAPAPRTQPLSPGDPPADRPTADPSESPAAKERRLMEWEAELRRQQKQLPDDD